MSGAPDDLQGCSGKSRVYHYWARTSW